MSEVSFRFVTNLLSMTPDSHPYWRRSDVIKGVRMLKRLTAPCHEGPFFVLMSKEYEDVLKQPFKKNDVYERTVADRIHEIGEIRATVVVDDLEGWCMGLAVIQ